MEVRKGWDARAYEAARRCLQAGRDADTETRKALERAAARYFFKACGMERDRPPTGRMNSLSPRSVGNAR